jgi:rhamnose utilization protein RhaD (predicted bifunctional aldolase and dehydrogenase)
MHWERCRRSGAFALAQAAAHLVRAHHHADVLQAHAYGLLPYQDSARVRDGYLHQASVRGC